MNITGLILLMKLGLPSFACYYKAIKGVDYLDHMYAAYWNLKRINCLPNCIFQQMIDVRLCNAFIIFRGRMAFIDRYNFMSSQLLYGQCCMKLMELLCSCYTRNLCILQFIHTHKIINKCRKCILISVLDHIDQIWCLMVNMIFLTSKINDQIKFKT